MLLSHVVVLAKVSNIKHLCLGTQSIINLPINKGSLSMYQLVSYSSNDLPFKKECAVILPGGWVGRGRTSCLKSMKGPEFGVHFSAQASAEGDVQSKWQRTPQGKWGLRRKKTTTVSKDSQSPNGFSSCIFALLHPFAFKLVFYTWSYPFVLLLFNV